jgi:pimeloyl-ACP methyl ester carboxylesterase
MLPGWRGDINLNERVTLMRDQLLTEGYAVVTVNPPGHGKSKGSLQSYTLQQGVEAVTRIVRWLARDERIEARRIFLVGTSLGGTVAALVAAQQADIAGLVLQSPRTTFAGLPDGHFTARPRGQSNEVACDALLEEGRQVDFEQVASAISCPTLIVHGETDTVIPPEESRQFFAQLGADHNALELIPGMGHMPKDPRQDDRVIKLTVDWITSIA